MTELVDVGDLKSSALKRRVGSTPTLGTVSSHSLMDRTQASEACDPGSIPGESTKFLKSSKCGIK